MKAQIKLTMIIAFLFGFCYSAVSQPADSVILNVISRVDTNRIDNIIKDISGENPVIVEGKEYIINNRYIKSPLNPIAAKYVYYKFMEYGYSPYFSSIRYPAPGSNFDLETIYAIKIGRTKPDEVVVFAASHDSKEKDSLGPGANENGSGLSVMLEASRIFKNVETERTIIFVSFDDWAQTGRGNYLLDSLVQNAKGNLLGIGLDMIGYYGGQPISVCSDDTTISRNLINAFFKIADIIKYPYPLIKKRLPGTPFFVFADNNYEGVYFIRNFPPSPPYLANTDIFANLELPFLHANARLAIGTLAYVAGIVDLGLGVDAMSQSKNIFPNPANTFLNVQDFLGFDYAVYNTLGEKVLKGVVTSELLNVESLPKGLYFLHFMRGREQTIKFFIKN